MPSDQAQYVRYQTKGSRRAVQIDRSPRPAEATRKSESETHLSIAVRQFHE